MKNETIEITLAKELLQIKAIKLEPANPFIWASGMKSPIYCDNRKTLSFPDVRNFICDAFVDKVKKEYQNVDMIAGVATGAIALGALVAERLGLPFIYIRSQSKGHGLENLIEGDLSQGKNIVVIEDLISTGGSSLKAVDALKKAEVNVLGLVAIFTYGFEFAHENFIKAGCDYHTLSDYNYLMEAALESGYITDFELNELQNWRKDPENWKK